MAHDKLHKNLYTTFIFYTNKQLLIIVRPFLGFNLPVQGTLGTILPLTSHRQPLVCMSHSLHNEQSSMGQKIIVTRNIILIILNLKENE